MLFLKGIVLYLFLVFSLLCKLDLMDSSAMFFLVDLSLVAFLEAVVGEKDATSAVLLLSLCSCKGELGVRVVFDFGVITVVLSLKGSLKGLHRLNGTWYGCSFKTVLVVLELLFCFLYVVSESLFSSEFSLCASGAKYLFAY